ncbi:MAG: hypothetical protein AAFQ79_05160 [Pseudomonadota bacterium]
MEFRGHRNLIALCVAIAFPAPSIHAQSAFTVLDGFVDDLATLQITDCDMVPVVEWLRYDACEVRYITELPGYLEEIIDQKLQRIEAERARPWSWLTAALNPDCQAIPNAERQKYAVWCDLSLADTDPLEQFRGQLNDLLVRRELLAAQLQQLRENYAALGEVAAFAPAAPNPELPEIEVLQEVLAKLDRQRQRASTLERAAEILQAGTGPSPISSLRFARLPRGVELLDGPSEQSIGFATNRSEDDEIIVLNENDPNTAMIAIVHPIHGLAYVRRAEISLQ